MTFHGDSINGDDRSTRKESPVLGRVLCNESKSIISHCTPPVDTEDLYKKAQSALFEYGMKFTEDIIVRAQGVFLYTARGHKILDWTSGQMACLLGHGHPEVSETISTHAKNLDHLLSSHRSPPLINLAYNLTEILPDGLDKVMFLSTGSESCEAAIKLAKIFTGRYEIVGLGSSWHGMTGASAAAQYHAGRRGHGPTVGLHSCKPPSQAKCMQIPGNYSLPSPNAYRSIFRNSDGSYDWKTEVKCGWEAIDRNSCGSLAAVIMEPILSSGGMLVLPPGYLRAIKNECKARGMLLILDEAQTAFGRCGDMFAFEYEGVVPDILTLSKTIGTVIPLSAVITSNEIASRCHEKGFLFCTTHVNDPLPAAVGLTVLNVVLRDQLAERARVLGQRLHAGLRSLQERYGCIGDVRGRGLLAGIEIVGDRVTKQPAPEIGEALVGRMHELGLSANLTAMSATARVFRIAPPITITDEELDLGLRMMEEAFRSTDSTIPLF